MPQEIEVRYILPAIRKELAKVLVNDHSLSQKEAAKILGITEAAVSQYRHSKRANEVVFSPKIIEEIRKSAFTILNDRDRQKFLGEMHRLANLTNVKQIVCDIHRSQSKDLAKCNVCFEDKELLTIRTK